MLLNCTVGKDSNYKEIKPVNPKGNQSWIFFGRTYAETEAPILWPPHAKNWLIGKDPDAGKDWRQEEKGTTEDEMVGWHHWLDGHEFEQALGVGDRQGSLACCSLWGAKTAQLNWTDMDTPHLFVENKSLSPARMKDEGIHPGNSFWWRNLDSTVWMEEC